MASFSHISGAEPSTVTFKAATVIQTRNSSAMHQELISLSDAESSLGIARVLAADPGSTEFGLVVRDVRYSTIVSVANTVSVQQGASTVFQVQVGGYSTIVTVATGNSSIIGFAASLMSSAVLAGNSSALNVRVAWSSTGLDQKVSESAGSGFSHGQVGMNSTATQILGANSARKRLLLIQHSSAVNIFLGPSTVTAGNGLLLAGVTGNQIVMRHTAAVFGITSASTSTISYVEETH